MTLTHRNVTFVTRALLTLLNRHLRSSNSNRSQHNRTIIVVTHQTDGLPRQSFEQRPFTGFRMLISLGVHRIKPVICILVPGL
jgi:hypothetical protein